MSGNGKLTVADGGTVNASSLFAAIGDLSGNGTVMVKGVVLDNDVVFDGTHGMQQSFAFGTGGSLNLNLDGSGELGAGNKGVGTLRIAEGITAACSGGWLGYNSGSTGTATVTGAGSTWNTGSSLYVGFNGSGTVNIQAGGKLSNSGTIWMGYVSGCTGTATVTGSGSQLISTAYFYVGNQGNGILNIEAGGLANTSTAIVGSSSGSTSVVTVTGAGSAWNNSNTLYLGRFGSGTLNIVAGGHVGTNTTYVGYASVSTGTVTVTGNGSTWTNNGDLYVNIGSLSVQAGGQVSNGDCYLGNSSGFTVSATITGAGSKWTTSNGLTIGDSGDGTLNISNGGVVAASYLTLASSNSVTGTCNIDSGGKLQAGSITRGGGTPILNWNDGTIQNYTNSGLNVTNSFGNLVLKLAATGTHAFNIDSGRIGSVDAVLSDATSGGTLSKLGAGKLTLSAVNTYTGSTTITGGTLALSSTGSLASSTIDVGNGTTFDVSAKSAGWTLGAGKMLIGSGTIVGNLTINGIHAPGNSPGIGTVKGNYNMLGQLDIELMGTTAGTGYDQVLLPLNGSTKYNVTLSGALALDWTGMNGSTDTTKLWILQNNTAGTLSGTFANYRNGADLGNHDGREWFLWYGADAATGNLTGGNDVVVTTVPEPSGLTLLPIVTVGLMAYAWRRRQMLHRLPISPIVSNSRPG